MVIKEIIERYLQLIETRDFLEYENDFANRLKEGISKGYRQNLQEPKIVEAIVNKINKNRLSKTINRFHISTTGIFIHGPKSVVEFEYYGTNTKRELGDLIFIISVIYNNKKYFEKLTITQFKKSKKPKWEFRKNDKEQLYLLSRFPTFKMKIIKNDEIEEKEYNLPNYSNCLGSYGFLYKPGDFVFASAKIVEMSLGSKSNIKIEDIYNIGKTFLLEPFCICYRRYCCYMDLFIPWKYIRYTVFPNYLLPIIGNSLYSSNVYEFSEKYLRSLIGDFVCAYELPHNKKASHLLGDIIEKIKKKAQKDKDGKTLEYIKYFYKYEYYNGKIAKNFNNDNGNDGHGGEKFEKSEGAEDGGIGIIHTIINLGEGR